MSMCVSIYTKPMVTYSPRERIGVCVCGCVYMHLQGSALSYTRRGKVGPQLTQVQVGPRVRVRDYLLPRECRL